MADTLAVAGGTPVRSDFLPLAASYVTEDDKKAVRAVLDGGQLQSGKKVKEFEENFARYVGARYAVAVSSGAAGIHIALMAAAVGHGEEVITSPLVHPSTPAAILHQNGVHTFADVDPATFNLDPDEVGKKVSLRTVALMPVHFAGRPCDMEAIQKTASEHKLEVVEDASHALGAQYRGKMIGSLSSFTVFSFDAPQGVYTGEGGMVVTDSEEQYFWLRVFRNGGIVTEPEKLSRREGPWHFEMQDRGFYYRMGEMQAALGLSQLRRADWYLERRREIAEQYNRAFAGVEQFDIPVPCQEDRHAWYYYVIVLRPENLKATRLEIFNALRAEKIGVGVQYLPAFMQPYFKWVGHPDICSLEGSPCPRAEILYKRLITLPLYPAMSQQDVQDVIEAVLKVVKYYAV